MQVGDAVRTDSLDVNAWINLGNGYYRGGEQGRAVWAWARAGELAPRNGAVAHNLQAVGAVEVLRTRPPLSVRPVEWYLLAAVVWWVACGLIIAGIRRRSRELRYWSVAPLVAAFIFLGVGLNAAAKRYAVTLDTDTILYGDPTVHSPVVRHVPGGSGLDVLEDRGEWLRVRTLTQTEGWVEAEAIGRL
ncbi:MAG TPA: SH3 domain-containing protein [Longimicrobiales bacterium]|nr:SH3 domain-containing protein [Longimicrobiales bacterium]